MKFTNVNFKTTVTTRDEIDLPLISRKKAVGRFWTAQQLQNLVSMYNQGKKTKIIAAKIGRNPISVSNKLTQLLKEQELIMKAAKGNATTVVKSKAS